MDIYYDVLIVGNGFSGNLLACELSSNGFSVAIVERRKETKRDTRFGSLIRKDCFSDFQFSAPDFLLPVSKREHVFLGTDCIIKKEDRSGHRNLFAFKREELDSFLKITSKNIGVRFFEDFCVDEITNDPNGFSCANSANKAIRAKVIVLAGGTEESILTINGFLHHREPEYLLFAVQQRLKQTTPSSNWQENPRLLELSFLPGFPNVTGRILSIDDELVITLFCLVKTKSYSTCCLQPYSYLQKLKEHPSLKELFRHRETVDWGTRIIGSFPIKLRRLYKDGVILIGDAALPLGGCLEPGAGFDWGAFTAREAAKVLSTVIPASKKTRLYLRRYSERIIEKQKPTIPFLAPFTRQYPFNQGLSRKDKMLAHLFCKSMNLFNKS